MPSPNPLLKLLSILQDQVIMQEQELFQGIGNLYLNYNPLSLKIFRSPAPRGAFILAPPR